MKNKLLKRLAFGLFALITLILVAATIVEKAYGTSFAGEVIYCSPWMVALWGVAAHFAFFYIVKRRLYKQIVTFSIHISFLLIITGAFLTHKYGIQGRVHLREDDSAVNQYILADGKRAQFPFSLQLQRFELQYYNGTFAPMDYVSHISLSDGEESVAGIISMNNIFKYRGYRFYQSGYDKDGKGSTLSVSYDPTGIAVTYIGYLCLFVSMLAFFFQRGSLFKRLLQHPALRRGVFAIAAVASASSVSASPQTLPKEVAESLCNLHVYYNDRICPLQTLARDFTAKLYGKTTYKGLTAEQVLAGWFFFYDDWKHEPMIKIKGEEVCRVLGIEGKFAKLSDFIGSGGYKLEPLLSSDEAPMRRNAESANEKFNLVSMLCTGSLMKIFPYKESVEDNVIWYSLSDKLPQEMPYEQWLFIGNSMNLVAEQIARNDWEETRRLLDKIGMYQRREAAGEIPSGLIFEAEKIYNSTNINRILAMSCTATGIISFILSLLYDGKGGRMMRGLRTALQIGLSLVLLYLTMRMALRGFIGGHLPLSNGFETMQFMAWCSLLLTLVIGNRFRLFVPFGYLICGLTMMVAMMGESTPRITQLMPVLQSPLLSIHVVVIMLAYTLFAFMMLNGVAALILNCLRSKGSEEKIENLALVSRLMLYPALFLLTIGIFVGAIWANVSWGRYWGWDPKEVWALITMLVYSAALHTQSLRWFCKPLNFHLYSVVAFITVLTTYFGVNFVLGGMHGYA